jgi:hypothetical protein
MADRSPLTARSRAMPHYRLYTLRADGHIAGLPAVIECPDDPAAVQEAKKILDGRAIEVWDRARMVIRLEPKHPGK